MRKGYLAALALTTLATTNAFAVLPGFYMGLMLGPSTNNGNEVQAQTTSTPPSTVTATPTSQQFGTRLYMGYKASQNWGAEGGLTYYSGITYDAGDASTCSSPNIRIRDFDIVMRGSYTFQNTGIEVFGKAGPALTYMSTSGCLNPQLDQECGKTTYSTQVKPTVSAGVSYDLTQNWVVDASWNRLFAASPVSSVDMYALGISYHFVDTYCGQFLCA
ncbi:MAG TPA: outer membrane beta-barrel protein [Gammaproteobacteria bacterium]|jgi:opacity protein-like surface antigen|nr:outer membrane beta-barrel protein [Gammaproteobacteria bacterium]